ncbi:MAG: DNA translocase FtsK 4TM domain-containing protein [Candidatus Pacebacteria bacterium]|nr:DNA translocase FtsK 4TM domain-containing protein [Candidatus Paceibacterota bacterium]
MRRKKGKTNSFKNRKNGKILAKEKARFGIALPEKTKRYLWAAAFLILAITVLFSFFRQSGFVGESLKNFLSILAGNVIFIMPVVFVVIALILLNNDESLRVVRKSITISGLVLLVGATGMFSLFELRADEVLKNTFIWDHSGAGGVIGYYLSWPLFKGFDFWVTFFIFLIAILVALFILFDLFLKHFAENEEEIMEKDKEKKEQSPLERIKEITQSKLPAIAAGKPREQGAEAATLDVKKPGKAFEERKKENLEYKYPPLDLLANKQSSSEGGDIEYNSAVIKRTLSTFGLPVEMDEINIGPTVTQYTLKPAEGIKLSKITALQNDLALALASQSIRIEAPIPGRSLVGVEIPNRKRAIVGLRDLLSSDVFKTSPSPLLIAVGKDVMGQPSFADLSEMPHLLVGGTTGSGKTICLNSVILSLIYRNGPDELKLVLVDPKRVEFPVYASLNHLLCPVIYDAQQTLVALKWLVQEMERRFTVLAEGKSRDITSFNAKAEKSGKDKLPYIVLIIDELADLMSVKGKEIESYVVRLAQMSRATGIHLILATQRPSVEVITGLIKANITSRIALKVGSLIDSRTILDASGAEKLLGKGDMLIMSKEYSKPRRMQCPYVSDQEIRRVANWLLENNSPESSSEEADENGYIESQKEENSLTGELQKAMETPEVQMDSFYSKEDPLYEEAKRMVISSKKASASLLQRRLGIGYARAARLLDILEERGIVGPAEGAKPRAVYISEETEE